MQILNVKQGTQPWAEARTKHFCASDAPAMLGYSKTTSRSELLRLKATGDVKEFSEWAQKNLLDKGHESEAATRAYAEALVEGDLYPTIGTLEVDGLPLLASFDGINFDDTIVWENKLKNKVLLESIAGGDMPDDKWPQIEQQLLISGAEKCLFTVGDGTSEGTRYIWYISKPERRAMLIAGWRTFVTDLANYQPQEFIPAAVATPRMGLPAVKVVTEGAITIISNLPVFGERLDEYIKGIDMLPSTDQAFADGEEAVKVLKEAEDALAQAEAAALAQTASIDDMRKTVALYIKLARATRLSLTGIIKNRKDTVRAEILTNAVTELNVYIAHLNSKVGKPYMPDIRGEFAEAMKGKKKLDSMREAVNSELARRKAEADVAFGKIMVNMAYLRETAADFKFLFNDTAAIIRKEADDFAATVSLRIATHKAEKAKAEEETRARIRAEEEAKARATAEAEAKRIQQETEARVRAQVEAERAEAERNALHDAVAVGTGVIKGSQHVPAENLYTKVVTEHGGAGLTPPEAKIVQQVSAECTTLKMEAGALLDGTRPTFATVDKSNYTRIAADGTLDNIRLAIQADVAMMGLNELRKTKEFTTLLVTPF